MTPQPVGRATVLHSSNATRPVARPRPDIPTHIPLHRSAHGGRKSANGLQGTPARRRSAPAMPTTRCAILLLLLPSCTGLSPRGDAQSEPADDRSSLTTAEAAEPETVQDEPTRQEPLEGDQAPLDSGIDGHSQRTQAQADAAQACEVALKVAQERYAKGPCGGAGSNTCAIKQSAIESIYETCRQSASIHAVGKCITYSDTANCTGPTEAVAEGGAAQLFDLSAGRIPVATAVAERPRTFGEEHTETYELRNRSGSRKKRGFTFAVFADAELSAVALEQIDSRYLPPGASIDGCKDADSFALVGREPYLDPSDTGDDAEVPLAVWIRCDAEDRLYRHTGFDAWNVGAPVLRWSKPEVTKWKVVPKPLSTFNDMANDARDRIAHLQACTQDADCGSIVVGKCLDCEHGVEVAVRRDAIKKARRLLPPSRYANRPDCPVSPPKKTCGGYPSCDNKVCSLVILD